MLFTIICRFERKRYEKNIKAGARDRQCGTTPVGFSGNDPETGPAVAGKSAEVTHNPPEGIRKALAAATEVYPAGIGKSKIQIGNYIQDIFRNDLNGRIDDTGSWSTADAVCRDRFPGRAIIDS